MLLMNCYIRNKLCLNQPVWSSSRVKHWVVFPVIQMEVSVKGRKLTVTEGRVTGGRKEMNGNGRKEVNGW